MGLLALIGRGGNAKVYEARRPDQSDVVALKVLNATNSGREPYLRFRHEIDFLTSLGERPGILPVLDHYLPEAPAQSDRAWMSMPLATTLSSALAEAKLSLIIEALSSIAETLAALARDHGAGHRDIKPRNLYERKGDWLVGDFGLVAAPDYEGLTRMGKALGPIHFQAPEMIIEPAAADPLPADVYSLAKTLWVLATGQNAPPPGHQLSGDGQLYAIGQFRADARAPRLDKIIERATRMAPGERPSMARLAQDLRETIGENVGMFGQFDVTGLRGRYQRATAPARQAEALRQRRCERFDELFGHQQERMVDLHRALTDLDGLAAIDLLAPASGSTPLEAVPVEGIKPLKQEFVGSGINARTAENPSIFIGRAMGVLEDGVFRFHARIEVLDSDGNQRFFWGSGWREVADIEAIEAETVIERATNELAEHLEPALEAYVAVVEQQ